MPSSKIIGRISSDPNISGKVGEINGVKDHNRLANRSLPDQHPIDAITGLREELEKRNPATNQKIKVWDAATEDYINFGANDEVILIAGNNISFEVITEEPENSEEELQIPSITINSTLDPKNQRVKTGNVIFDADAVVNIIADTAENNPIEVIGDNDPNSPNYNSISIKHKEVSDAADAAAVKVGKDNYGHVILGDSLKTSDLINDGDGTDNNSPFATQKWVDTNGGKIDIIKINGVTQPVTDKTVDLPAYPTRTSLNIDNINNTSDADKPISNATQAALDLKADKSTTYTKTETDTLLNAKQDTINQNNKLSSDLVDDTNKTHKFVTAAEKTQIATNTTDISTINNSIIDINSKIPSAAAANNQLADKAFVNSSIGTATANFIGTFSNITELESYTGIVTNNDYAFVQNQVLPTDYANFAALDAVDKTTLSNYDYGWVINATHNNRFDLYRFDIINQTWINRAENVAKSEVTLNTAYNRYKAAVNNNVITWSYEYTLNNSSFTVEQWNAINSGINTLLVADIQSNYAAIHGVNGLDSRVSTLEGQVPDIIEDVSDLQTGLAGKQDTINDLSDIRSGAGLGATAVQPWDLAAVATSGDYDDLLDKPDLTGFATKQEVNTGLAGKQDTISDLDNIRSGAALGATALQEVPSEYITESELTTILADYVENEDLADVAISGDYDDLLNKPEPTKQYLEIATITGVSGTTTASKATQGTALVYGTADVDTAVDVATDLVDSNDTSANAYKAEYNANKCSLKLTALRLSKSSITPAKAADNTRTITPYTFADVTVPVADQSATTVATGGAAGQGAATHGIQVVTDFSAVNNNNNNNNNN